MGFSLALAPVAFGLLAQGGPAPDAPQVEDAEKARVRRQQTEVVRLSLPTEDDRAAWRRPGLRVALGYGYAFVEGKFPAFSFHSHTFALRPSVRLDEQWAAGVALMYGTGPQGVRWSVTAEPTFYPLPTRQLAVTLGFGFGGLVVYDFDPTRYEPSVSVENGSRDLGPDEPLDECSGAALSTLARTDYLFVAGPLFASGPFVQAQAQWTECKQPIVRFDSGNPARDPSTGRPYYLTQWWRQTGVTLGWWLTWR